MFEIILSEEQLIKSLKFSIDNELDSLKGIFQNCRFSIHSIAGLNYTKIIKDVVGTYEPDTFPKTLKETQLKSFIEYGSCHVHSSRSGINPFSFFLPSKYKKLQDILEYKADSTSLEFSLRSGEDILEHFREIQVAQNSGHILIYDPYFLEQFETGISTITELFALNPPYTDVNICIITTRQSTPLSSVLPKLKALFNGNLSILLVRNAEHDRRGFSDMFSVKPGSGFAFMESGKCVLPKSATIDLKNLLNQNNYRSSKKKYEEIMALVKSNYGYRFKYLDPIWCQASNKFRLNNYIAYSI